MNKKELIQMVLTAVSLITLTTAIFLYAGGYRLKKSEDNKSVTLKSTGLISVKSIPEGANVYINGVLATATNNTIASVEPGIHTIKVVKNGYAPWTKEVEIFPELATDITAVLVSQSPRLEPLTNTGASNPVVSPTLTKLAFLSNDVETPGVWVVSLTEGALSLFKSSPSVVLKDTSITIYSKSKSIEWSPDEQDLLVQLEDDRFQLFNLNDKSIRSFFAAEDVAKLKDTWDADVQAKRKIFIEKLDIPQNLQEKAISKDVLWAPDEKKFLYTVQNGEQTEYRVYNSEKPLPVGEKQDSLAYTLKSSDPKPQVSWYSDSFHLVTVEGNTETDKKGTIFITRIDGTNKTEIYNNSLFFNRVFVAPGGDKIIMLTSFKSSAQTDLYTIGLR